MISDCNTRMPRSRVRMHIVLCSWNVSLKGFRKSEYPFLLGEVKDLLVEQIFLLFGPKQKGPRKLQNYNILNFFIWLLDLPEWFLQWLETTNILLKLF